MSKSRAIVPIEDGNSMFTSSIPGKFQLLAQICEESSSVLLIPLDEHEMYLHPLQNCQLEFALLSKNPLFQFYHGSGTYCIEHSS
mmetsp:Transcript_16394/g.25019  ORF Transcript_16394/g.25019 Transcript_16394/m.25019 type:complete len:85 (+) Transcript_16394:107-361(+)